MKGVRQECRWKWLSPLFLRYYLTDYSHSERLTPEGAKMRGVIHGPSSLFASLGTQTQTTVGATGGVGRFLPRRHFG